MKRIIKSVIAVAFIITASSAHSQSWFPAKNLNAFFGSYEGGG